MCQVHHLRFGKVAAAAAGLGDVAARAALVKLLPKQRHDVDEVEAVLRAVGTAALRVLPRYEAALRPHAHLIRNKLHKF